MRGLWRCALLGLGLMVGCNQEAALNPDNGGKESNVAGLRQFNSEQEFVDFFNGQLDRGERLSYSADLNGTGVIPEGGFAPGGADVPAAAPVPGGDSDAGGGGFGGSGGGLSAPPGASGTTVQEEGVDEADIVKNDGHNLFILTGGTLRIVSSDQGVLTRRGELALKGYGRDLYLTGDRAIALTADYSAQDAPTSGTDGEAGGLIIDVPVFGPPMIVATIVDVSNLDEPKVVSTVELEGSLASSRLVGGTLHMVSAVYPGEFMTGGMHMLAAAREGAEVGASGNVSLRTDQIAPRIEIDVNDSVVYSGAAVGWRDMLRPFDPDGAGMLTVVSLPVDAPDQFKSVGVVGEPGLVYVSPHRLYVTDMQFDFSGEMRETTDIYRFELTTEGPAASGSATITGRVLNQYSMSEFEGNLRVASTSFEQTGTETQFGFTYPVFEPTNHVFVLGDVEGEWGVRGRLENVAPGETIQSARFLGARGFLVTFEEIDPLFTLDLSNPDEPTIIGELKVPGFSTFMLPMDAEHLLTIGSEVDDVFFFPTGIQLSIFDVSDLAHPTLMHREIIENAYSEAQWDPKALTWFSEEGLLAIPVTKWEGDFFGGWIEEPVATGEGEGSDGGAGGHEGDSGEQPIEEPWMPFQGLFVYGVSTDGGFSKLAEVNPAPSDVQYFWPSFIRGVFFGRVLHAVTDFGVVTTSMDAPSETLGSVEFEPDIPGYWGGIFEDVPGVIEVEK